ncbi:hypothetical protein BT96DRAFT_959610 [Gymnopus androsaceus JB14]|uniref:EF-1-gamma C-terminal domain-containing protein n=1 Tax=Gymnopus androsaceus JB14 TaxID=1447944 RepID=A0A6A4H1F1_9AGAR|nr:hypothetical protein BT96DRAFT_959610 [Gymnopus androsaceus JB14]
MVGYMASNIGSCPEISVNNHVSIFNRIATLAPNSGLLGSSPKDASLVDIRVYARSVLSGILNNHLSANTFFVGERITLPNLRLLPSCSVPLLSASMLLHAKYPAVMRLLETIVDQTQLKEVFGEAEHIEKDSQFTPPKKEKEPKEAKPAAAPKPKAKEVEEEDEPLDWMKRAYSDKDTGGKDGGLLSLAVDFKYNNELTQTFMSSNQMASRKYFFGSISALSKANDSIIAGALISRGQDIQPEFFEGALASDLKIDGKEWVDGKNRRRPSMQLQFSVQ